MIILHFLYMFIINKKYLHLTNAIHEQPITKYWGDGSSSSSDGQRFKTGGIKEELEKQVESLNLKNVKFLGSIDEEEKVVLLNLCYGFIFPSHLRTEAFGISLLEASAFGKPMISCEIGSGTSFVNKHNETGLVINPGSSKELYSAMKFLLDNQDTAKEMGKRAKIRAAELFSSQEQANAYYKLYQELLYKKT